VGKFFSNVHIGSGSMGQQMPFDFTPWGATATPIHTAGVMKPGMTVIPDYGFADAPDPDVVVVGPNREMTSSVRGCGKSTRSTR